MEFTKHQTNIAKGVAICLMFIHHLYGFSDRLLEGNRYSPILDSLPVEFHVAKFGNICVSVFLFLSGYGLFLGYCRSSKGSFHYAGEKLIGFYKTYWLYFLIFAPIGLIFFQDVTLWDSQQIRYAADPATFLSNFFGWQSTYNQEWWFVRLFAVTLAALFPLYAMLAQTGQTGAIAAASFLLALIGYHSDPYGVWGFTFWQPSFALGIVYARFNLFSRHRLTGVKSGWAGIAWGWAGPILLLFALRTFALGSSPKLDFLMAPVFIYCSVQAIAALRLSRPVAYLGQYSFPLWLTHSFFCYYYFQDIVYAPRWSPLIFLLLLALSLPTVLGIELLGKLAASISFKWFIVPLNRLRKLPKIEAFLKLPL